MASLLLLCSPLALVWFPTVSGCPKSGSAMPPSPQTHLHLHFNRLLPWFLCTSDLEKCFIIAPVLVGRPVPWHVTFPVTLLIVNFANCEFARRHMLCSDTLSCLFMQLFLTTYFRELIRPWCRAVSLTHFYCASRSRISPQESVI